MNLNLQCFESKVIDLRVVLRGRGGTKDQLLHGAHTEIIRG